MTKGEEKEIGKDINVCRERIVMKMIIGYTRDKIMRCQLDKKLLLKQDGA